MESNQGNNPRIIFDVPPIYDEIDAAFKVKGRPVIFAWGDRIYNPQRIVVTPELLAHEAVHGQRQGSTEKKIREWWYRYLDSSTFRLEEEIAAHRAEYQHLVKFGNRQQRKAALKQTAAKLAAPLYASKAKGVDNGLGLISQKQALLILQEPGLLL